MSARIARGTSVNVRQTPKRASGGTRRPAPRRKESDLLAALGLSGEAFGRLSRWVGAGVLAAVLIAALLIFRVPQLIGTAIGEGVGGAGFTVQHVEVNGEARVPQLAIYNIAYDQPSMAMPLVDLEGTRARLLQIGWIKEARVSRRLPDTLVVDVVERTPAAVWQQDGRLRLIDVDGVVLEEVRLEAMPSLPLVIGPGANRNVPALARLIDQTPHLKPQLSGASWVGGRRWDLRFTTGEVLALPDGDDAARRALLNFARMDQQTQLLGRGFARFDMRIPGRFIVRVTRTPGSTVPAIAPDTPPDPGQVAPEDLARTI